MSTTQATNPSPDGTDKKLLQTMAEACVGLVPNLPVIQAGKFDDAEPRLELGDTADTTLVSPIEGLLAIRRRRRPDGVPVAGITSLAEAVGFWSDALQKNLSTTATGDFDAFLLRAAAERLQALDDLMHELAEFEELDAQIDKDLLDRLKAFYPRWRNPPLLGCI